MKALIVINAYIKNKSQISQADRIGQELKALGVDVQIKKNVNLAGIENGFVSVTDEYDFCVFLDKDKVAARLLEKSGLRLFNSARAVEVCDNKMLTHIALAESGIAMPDSIYAPLCYYYDALPSAEFLDGVINRLGFPLVAKASYGSLGAGVCLIESEQALYEYEKNNMITEHFYQRFIDCGRGEDIRVIVVGGNVVCAMKRVNYSDFRSNIELGGNGVIFKLDEELTALCEKVASILKLDYCGVDILTDKSGNRYICEVNSNAFFSAAEKVCGVNVAAAYAAYMLDKIKKL